MTIIHGDCLEELKKLPDNSIDALCCDPPAGVAFMSRNWDSDKGGRDHWIAWLADIMREALRVLKPGAHGLVWSLPRTSHWTATALEDAGFEIRDCVYHVFGSGFPKSHNISIAIDKMLGADREIIGIGQYANKGHTTNNTTYMQSTPSHTEVITAPATPEAQQWYGYGTALKPSVETWWLIRKPLAESSIAAQVLATGTGGINIDACRVGTGDDRANGGLRKHPDTFHASSEQCPIGGRWPSHLLLSHSLWCDDTGCVDGCPVLEMDRQSGISKSSDKVRRNKAGAQGYGGSIHSWQGIGFNDQGGASRYFQTFHPDTPFIYAAKASRRERNAGGEALPASQGFDTSKQIAHINHGTGETTYSDYTPSANSNTHPTVKPQQLMRYLVRLITPPDGIVLDPFSGSGSTAVACIAENKQYILIEREIEYVEIARARIEHALKEIRA